MSKSGAYIHIQDKAAARIECERLIDLGKPTAVDTEFDDDAGPSKTQLMSYCVDGEVTARVVDARYIKYYKQWFEYPASQVVYQNYKADYDAISRYDIETRNSFHADTMILSWNHDENQLRHGLKAQSLRWLKWKRQEYKDLFSYVPVGLSKPVTLMPSQCLKRLPDAAVAAMRHKYGFDAAKAQEFYRKIMLQYSADDAVSTIQLYRLHRDYLEETGYWNEYLRVDRPYTLTLMNCEARGVMLDTPRLTRILRKVDIQLLACLHIFRTASKDPDFNPNSGPQIAKLFLEKWKWPIRKEFITASGKPSLDKEALQWWSEQGLKMADVKLTWNGAKTLKGTFLTGLLNGVSEDGRLRSDFVQLGARTGRISSRKRYEKVIVERTLKSGEKRYSTRTVASGANLQNIPSRKEKDPYGIRKAFRAPRLGEYTAHGTIAEEPHSLIVCDYSGFELVMVIHWISQFRKSSPMLDAMRTYGSPSSVHAYTAIKLYADRKHICDARCVADEYKHKGLNKAHQPGRTVVLGDIPMDEWTTVKSYFADEYSIAKNNNFNLLYGGSARMMARLRGLDPNNDRHVAECKAQIVEWNRIYPEVEQYQRTMLTHGVDNGWVPTIGGRQQSVELLLSGRFEDGRAPKNADEQKMNIERGKRKCYNSPAQGSASDIVKEAMNLIENDEELRSYRAALLFPVHDEVVLEVPMVYAEAALARTTALMKLPYREKMKFDLAVDGKTASNWLDAK